MGESSYIEKRNSDELYERETTTGGLLDFHPCRSGSLYESIFSPGARIDWLPGYVISDTRFGANGSFEIFENCKLSFSYGPKEGETFVFTGGILSAIVRGPGHELKFDESTSKWQEWKEGKLLGEYDSHGACFTSGMRQTTIELKGAITPERLYGAYKAWQSELAAEQGALEGALDIYSAEQVNELRQMLIDNEDWRNKPYLCSRNYPTAGVGFLLTRSDARQIIEEVGGNYDRLLASARLRDDGQKESLTDEQVDRILVRTLKETARDARTVFPEFDTYPFQVQKVLIDLTFNMGPDKLKTEFPRFQRAIEERNFAQAARCLDGTKYAAQVKGRATRNINALKDSGEMNLQT